jgi:phosphoglucomutase
MLVAPGTIARAEAWSRQDPNEHSAAYVTKLVGEACRTTQGDEDAAGELQVLFPEEGRISFGTAGLRSAMKPGPLGMNDLVVLQTAQGLAKYCLQENDGSKGRMCAVVGYDHRSNESLQLSSLSFAILTALVFREAGMDYLLLDGLVATPLVPFCLGQIPHAVVGIMITASHNPKQDAGYKVYWNDGCQIRSPVDQGIAQSILENLDPWIDYKVALQQKKQENPADPSLGLSSPEQTKTLVGDYFKAIKESGLWTGQSKLLKEAGWTPPCFVYTAMHGVGYPFTKASFENFGIPAFLSVPAQEQPDPTFPTVIFPNPEEQGALDLAKAFAAEQCPDQSTPIVLLANDPDADRLAVAEREQDKWTVFKGDQIGVLLGHWLWTQLKTSPSGDKRPISMCASTVSSQMLRQIAKTEGFYFEDTVSPSKAKAPCPIFRLSFLTFDYP